MFTSAPVDAKSTESLFGNQAGNGYAHGAAVFAQTSVAAGVAWADDITPEQEKLFEEKIRPLLSARCFKCHGPEKQESDLRLDSRDALLKGGENGPVLVPGKPQESLLIEAVHQTGDLVMPPEPAEKLSEEQIAILERWVAEGAEGVRGIADRALVEAGGSLRRTLPVMLLVFGEIPSAFAVAGAGLHVASESLGTSVVVDADRAAGGIAKQLAAFFAEQGWTR